MRHDSTAPDSPVGNLAHCDYTSGTCLLKDGSMLLWTPDKEEECRFLPVMKMRGHRLGDIWISDSREFALSWTDSSDRVKDCGADLTVSDQGYAIATVTRRTRSSDSKAGIVTSNQLAAQLLAVEGSMSSAVATLFRHALSALCGRTNLLAFALHTSLAIDPTLTVRNLLDRDDIAATFLGNDLLQIHRCMLVPPRNFRLVPFNSTCYTKPIAEITFPGGSTVHSFIDTSTLVLSHEAPTAPCAEANTFYFAQGASYLKFNALAGTFETLPSASIRNVGFPSGLNASSIALPLTIFHNLVLTNLSELVQDHQWSELWSSASSEQLLRLASSPSQSPSQSTVNIPSFSFSFWSLLFGSWSPFEVWVALCCAVVSTSILRTLIILYCNLYYPGWQIRLRELLSFRSSTVRQEAAIPLTSFPVVSPVLPTAPARDRDHIGLLKLTPPMRGRLAHRSLKSTCCTYPIEIDSS
uniref:Protein kinase domain-containing protein n=1 Tax=Haemonchus contortus TaxID=6289 RepID=A0A7I4YJC5_HAECO